jgi:hypothetical protein
MSINKIVKGIVCVGFMLLFFLSASAQTTPTAPKLSPANCFDEGLYSFQSVQVSVGPEHESYGPGANIKFSGEIRNDNPYPVVDGNVFVRISKDNENYIYEGFNIQDEFIALSNVVVDASSTLPVSFSWTVPDGLGKGEYRADYFFSVGKKFNLGGLPFTNEIVIGYSNFAINSSTETEFMFDRSKTTVNGNKYNHIGALPRITKNQKIDIKQPVSNFSENEKKLDVKYELYYWDSLDKKDLVSAKGEVITVPANSSATLSYEIPNSLESVYYVKITAFDGKTSSIVNVRVSSNVENSRINYPAITNFPLTEGESFNLFSCYHNVYGESADNVLSLALYDKKGEVVYQDSYKTTMVTAMSAVATKLTATRDYTELKLKAEIKNKDGAILDSYETEYKCSDIKSEKCRQLILSGLKAKSLPYISFFVILALVFLVLAGVNRNKPGSKKAYLLFAVISILIAVFVFAWVFILKTGVSFAQPYDQNPSNYRSSAPTTRFHTGWTRGADYRHVTDVTVTRLIQGQVRGLNNLKIGQKFFVDTSSNCTYVQTGGVWDTPNCGVAEHDYAGTLDSAVFVSEPGLETTLEYNTAVLSCVLHSTYQNSLTIETDKKDYRKFLCTAVGPGSSEVKAVIPNATATVKSCVETQDFGAIVSSNNTANNAPGCETSGKGINSDRRLGVSSSSVGPFTSGNNTITLGGTNMSWQFTVAEEPLLGSCTASPAIANMDQTVTWTVTVSGGIGNYEYSWTGTDGLSGTTASVDKVYTTSGQKYATTTVKSGAKTESFPCPGSISGAESGGGVTRTGGGGISVSEVDVVNVSLSAFPSIVAVGSSTVLTWNISAGGFDACTASGDGNWSGSKSQTTGSHSEPGVIAPKLGWNYYNIVCRAGSAISTSTAYVEARNEEIIPHQNAILSKNCYIAREGATESNEVAVNTNTIWKVYSSMGTEFDTDYSRVWTIKEGKVTSNPVSSQVLQKVFTTVGAKTINVTVASGTESYVCATNSSSATTSVVLPGDLSEL